MVNSMYRTQNREPAHDEGLLLSAYYTYVQLTCEIEHESMIDFNIKTISNCALQGSGWKDTLVGLMSLSEIQIL